MFEKNNYTNNRGSICWLNRSQIVGDLIFSNWWFDEY